MPVFASIGVAWARRTSAVIAYAAGTGAQQEGTGTGRTKQTKATKDGERAGTTLGEPAFAGSSYQQGLKNNQSH
jgi:hypothetical protein